MQGTKSIGTNFIFGKTLLLFLLLSTHLKLNSSSVNTDEQNLSVEKCQETDQVTYGQATEEQQTRYFVFRKLFELKNVDFPGSVKENRSTIDVYDLYDQSPTKEYIYLDIKKLKSFECKVSHFDIEERYTDTLGNGQSATHGKKILYQDNASFSKSVAASFVAPGTFSDLGLNAEISANSTIIDSESMIIGDDQTLTHTVSLPSSCTMSRIVTKLTPVFKCKAHMDKARISLKYNYLEYKSTTTTTPDKLRNLSFEYFKMNKVIKNEIQFFLNELAQGDITHNKKKHLIVDGKDQNGYRLYYGPKIIDKFEAEVKSDYLGSEYETLEGLLKPMLVLFTYLVSDDKERCYSEHDFTRKLTKQDLIFYLNHKDEVDKFVYRDGSEHDFIVCIAKNSTETQECNNNNNEYTSEHKTARNKVASKDLLHLPTERPGDHIMSQHGTQYPYDLQGTHSSFVDSTLSYSDSSTAPLLRKSMYPSYTRSAYTPPQIHSSISPDYHHQPTQP